MNIIDSISSGLMPVVVMIVIAYGLIKKVSLMDSFTDGAKKGLITVFNILPTLTALMCASSVFVKSDLSSVIEKIISPVVSLFGFPSELVPLLVVKMFSSSAATGLITEIFSSFGPDSYIGRTAAIMLACTETVFYTMSVYFNSVNVKNTLYTLRCCIFSILCGALASAFLAGVM